MNDDICRATAEKFEKKIAQLYVVSTIEAVLFIAASLLMIFFKAGFSPFAVMQAIGMTLLILLVVSAVIFFRKKRLKSDLLKDLNNSSVREDEMKRFLKENPTEFEFISALVNPPQNLKK